MDQTEYCEEILQRFGMEDCKPVMTPLMVGGKLSRTQEGCWTGGSAAAGGTLVVVVALVGRDSRATSLSFMDVSCSRISVRGSAVLVEDIVVENYG